MGWGLARGPCGGGKGEEGVFERGPEDGKMIRIHGKVKGEGGG